LDILTFKSVLYSELTPLPDSLAIEEWSISEAGEPELTAAGKSGDAEPAATETATLAQAHADDTQADAAEDSDSQS